MAGMEQKLPQISRRYKMTERKFFEKYDNLSKNELNTKSNKEVYVKNDVTTFVIKHSRGEKEEVKKRNIQIQKKINDSRL